MVCRLTCHVGAVLGDEQMAHEESHPKLGQTEKELLRTLAAPALTLLFDQAARHDESVQFPAG